MCRQSQFPSDEDDRVTLLIHSPNAAVNTTSVLRDLELDR